MDFNKKKRNVIVPVTALFCVAYIFFSFIPLRPELHLVPEWSVGISNVQEKSASDNVLLPFRLSQNLGYFTPSGKIVSCMTFPFKSAVSESYYATFGASSESTDFFANDGTPAGKIEVSGFPFFDEDRIFVFLPGGTSFMRCDNNGGPLWKHEGFSPITAFDSTSGGCVAGFADGTLASFSADGKLDQKFVPGGSDVDVILGAGISYDGKKIACVSGRDRQRFLVAERNNAHSKIIFHEYLDSQLVRQTIVRFSPDSQKVYYNYNGGLGIVDLEKTERSRIPLAGKISQIEFSEESELVFVLSKNEGKYTVTVIEPLDHPVASFSFEGESSFIQVKGSSLFVGRDDKISCISISQK